MRVAVNSHALPIYKKNRVASLLCIFETIIHAYVYDKYSDTLITFNMLCPLNKAKVVFRGSS